MKRNGWTLLFYRRLAEQLWPLHLAFQRAKQRGELGAAKESGSVKLLRTLVRTMEEIVPLDPARAEYRQGNTLGTPYRHWRRVKVGQRFRLFFRYDSASRTIIYAWVNDAQTLRAAGSKTDPYAVFAKMLARGNPPDDWSELLRLSHPDWDMREP